MRKSVTADELRRLRGDAGLSQRELAVRAEIPQPNIAAYERGRRAPSPATVARLTAALRVPTLQRLQHERASIIEAAVRRGIADVRVFGSVARGEPEAGSDVDLLVHPGPTTSVFDLAAFMADVADLLGVDVDVVSDRGTGPAMARIRAEAVPL